MTARIDSVARYICEKSGWKVSNLKLQKMLYLSQMIHMGRNRGTPLFEGQFQAWDFGPVEPSIYHRAKAYGSSPLPDIFENALTFKETDPRRKLLDDVCGKFLTLSPGELVDITHWSEGAWAEVYRPGAKGVSISNEAILKEYHARTGK